MKKKLYISLPITGRRIEEAKAEAEIVKLAFRWLDYEVVNPFDVVSDGDTYEEAMGKDIAALLTCQEVYFAPSWSQSRGCRLERAAAEIYNIKIVEQSAEI